MSEMNVEKNAELLESLHLGDRIAFNATLISIGDLHHLHHLRAWGIKKLDGHADIHAYAHKTGRYKLKYDFDESKLKTKLD